MKISTHPLGPDLDCPRVVIDVGYAARLLKSFEVLGPHLDRSADLFYINLFAADPSLRSLFKTDISEQKRRLVAMLYWIAHHLDDRPHLQATIRDLGTRHVQYHVLPQHYPLFLNALLAAMGQAAGEAWNEQDLADWRIALERIAEIMLGKP